MSSVLASLVRWAAVAAVVLAGAALAAGSAGCRVAGADPAAESDAAESGLQAYRQGRDLVTEALERLGGAEAFAAAGGVVVDGEGWTNLGARYQGKHPDSSGRAPYDSRFAVDGSAERVLLEVETQANADAREHVQYTFDGTLLRIVDRLSGGVFWDSAGETHRRRYARIAPHLLLADALDRRATLRHLGPRQVPGEDEPVEAVAVTLAPAETVTLLIGASSKRLVGAEYLLDLPLRGDTVVRWTYAPDRTVDGLGRYPTGHRITVGGDVLTGVRYTRISPGAAAADFALPLGVQAPDPPDAPQDVGEPAGQKPAVPPPGPLREITDGVYLAPGVRPGFHMLVVAFADFSLVVDAPAGWHELDSLPARNLVPWATSSAVGQRLLDTVREHLPGKPVRYVALTHFHSDHAGGIRPFVDAGATVLASAVTTSVVERAVDAQVTLAPDALTGRDVEPDVTVVDGTYTVRDSTMEVRLIDVGSNPHADGMLVVYLPRQKILYQSDLFEPLPDAYFPSEGRVPVMRWFVDWLDESGLAADRIYAVHGQARVRDEHLEEIRALGAE